MATTELQEKTAKAIVNVFETGKIRGDYAAVTLMAGDTGHLTYGRSQTTLASGNLYLLLKAYCEAAGAQFATALNPYLPRLQKIDLSLDQDMTFRGLLRDAGADPVMQTEQDEFFDRAYWSPACRSADNSGIQKPLGTAVVYDSTIQGSWGTIRDQVNAKLGRISAQVPEEKWIQEYVASRRAWLAAKSALLAKTVYRMDEFNSLISQGKWNLELPMTVRKLVIDEKALEPDAPLPVRASAVEGKPARLLQLMRPYMTGDDVKELQRALQAQDFSNSQDGVFGPFTDVLVKQFQRKKNMVADGIVGAQTRAELGI
jgi:chitosanase